jgi:hypothetical protein
MTESLPFIMLSPLGWDLTSLLQPKKKNARETAEAETEKGPSAPGGENALKKHRMMTVLRVVLDTPPPIIQKRTAPSTADEATEAPQQAKSSGGPLGTTLLETDRFLLTWCLRKILRGRSLLSLQHQKGRRLKKPLWKKEASTYDTWKANNFPKRIYQNWKNLLCLVVTGLDSFSLAA